MNTEDYYEKPTLYADNIPYEEYINRKLLESVQYKPKEEDMAKYYNYEVEEENNSETEDDKKLGFTGEILAATFSLLFFGGILGTLFWILGTLISGG